MTEEQKLYEEARIKHLQENPVTGIPATGNQLTKTVENVTCAAVSNAGESMDEKKREALDWFKRFVETDGHGNYDTILAVLQAPSVCTHSCGQSIETVPVAVADAMAEALYICQENTYKNRR